MNDYNPTSLKTKSLLAVVALALSVGAAEIVTGSMMHPDPETAALRERVLAAQSERAARIRELARGEVRVADTAAGDRI